MWLSAAAQRGKNSRLHAIFSAARRPRGPPKTCHRLRVTKSNNDACQRARTGILLLPAAYSARIPRFGIPKLDLYVAATGDPLKIISEISLSRVGAKHVPNRVEISLDKKIIKWGPH